MRRLTTDEGRDPIDGSELNSVRTTALALIGRDDDELTDREIFARQADDDFWYVSLCLEMLHRLPSEVSAILLCREYTELQAYHLIKRAMEGLARTFQES